MASLLICSEDDDSLFVEYNVIENIFNALCLGNNEIKDTDIIIKNFNFLIEPIDNMNTYIQLFLRMIFNIIYRQKKDDKCIVIIKKLNIIEWYITTYLKNGIKITDGIDIGKNYRSAYQDILLLPKYDEYYVNLILKYNFPALLTTTLENISSPKDLGQEVNEHYKDKELIKSIILMIYNLINFPSCAKVFADLNIVSRLDAITIKLSDHNILDKDEIQSIKIDILR